ncbi:MAG: hypothetical protein JNN17_21425 [Verrucomicrobiaceae bacterium]|nr:hypothetical protein [Verrucomicrobiaceae bacterium]
MKNADEKLTELWKSARTAATSDVSAEETLTPGIATRIASRWTTDIGSSGTLASFERITACCLVPCVIAFAAIAWLRPAPARIDPMSALFSAHIEVENDLPF